MHLHTIVKTKANSEQEAIENINGLLTNDWNYNFQGGFDYVSEEDTTVLPYFTEEDFQKLRQDELKEYEDNLKRANELPIDSTMKGYYLVCAGEALQSDIFWSTQRYAYEDEYNTDGSNTYYLTTDRHF